MDPADSLNTIFFFCPEFGYKNPLVRVNGTFSNHLLKPLQPRLLQLGATFLFLARNSFKCLFGQISFLQIPKLKSIAALQCDPVEISVPGDERSFFFFLSSPVEEQETRRGREWARTQPACVVLLASAFCLTLAKVFQSATSALAPRVEPPLS